LEELASKGASLPFRSRLPRSDEPSLKVAVPPVLPFCQDGVTEPVCKRMRTNDEVRKDTASAPIALLPVPLCIGFEMLVLLIARFAR